MIIIMSDHSILVTIGVAGECWIIWTNIVVEKYETGIIKLVPWCSQSYDSILKR